MRIAEGNGNTLEISFAAMSSGLMTMAKPNFFEKRQKQIFGDLLP